MTTLRISITKEVLEATKDCTMSVCDKSCAISYAVRQIWPDALTHYGTIAPFGFNSEARIWHGQDRFIMRFDRARTAERAAMKPFSFEIEVPDEVINDVNIDEIREILKTSKTLQIV